MRERSRRPGPQEAPWRRYRPGPAMTILGLSLTDFRRLYRWLNLTLVHQAVWPIALLLAGAPSEGVRALPLPWYLLRLAAPVLAAALALIYLTQPPPAPDPPSGALPPPRSHPPTRTIQAQVRLLLVGLTVALAVARIAIGPTGPALRLLVFGAADVAAFHLIHFGVMLRSASSQDADRGAVALFALSWGLRTALLAAVEAGSASVLLGFGGGFVLGAAVGSTSLLLCRWLGDSLSGAAFHWLVIYLILGFAE